MTIVFDNDPIEDFEVKVGGTSQSNPESKENEPEDAAPEAEPVDVVQPEPVSEPDVESAPEPTQVDVAEVPAEAEEQACEPETQDVMLGIIEELRRQNEELLRKFDEKIANDEHKAQLFDKMYGELQGYKADLYAKILKPFVLSTITLLDDTNTFISKLGEDSAPAAERYLRGIPDDLVDILEANGVELYEDDGEHFNPRTQRAVKQLPTDNPELDNTIAKRVRKGYIWNGVTIRPEFVYIYKYKQA